MLDNVYAEYGAFGMVCCLFAYMIMNLIKSQKEQSDDLDSIRQSIAKTETKMNNVESVLLKMLDRWNSSDTINKEERDRRHEVLMKELDDLSDSIAYISGRLGSRG
jgi:septal ring factor EnvC (AmiA/AmiB activator)|tara:strand:- start:413 stop:730 length:318 start_codon:yes stop_codon:yes gene_type:complete